MQVFKINKKVKYGWVNANPNEYIIMGDDKAFQFRRDLKDKVTYIGALAYTGVNFSILDKEDFLKLLNKKVKEFSMKTYSCREIIKKIKGA